MVFGNRKQQQVSQIIEDEGDRDSLSEEEEQASPQQQQVENKTAPTSSREPNSEPIISKPLLKEVILIGVANTSSPGGSKHWRCKHCLKEFTSSYTRMHCHFFGPPIGKKARIQRCNALLKNREEFDRIRRQVEAAEKSGDSPRLKCSTITKNKIEKKESKPLNEAFQSLERADVDLKVMKALCAKGIPFNVLRNPHFVEMVSAINNGPKSYKPPTFDKARTVLLDECKRSVEKRFDSPEKILGTIKGYLLS